MMRKYRLFLDRRAWSNASLVIYADSAEEAIEAFHQGRLDDRIRRLFWDDDDVETSLVDLEEEDGAVRLNPT